MAGQIGDEELKRAEENLKRLEAFFAVRTTWQAEGEAAAALAATRSAAAALLSSMSTLMQQLGIMLPRGMQRKERPQQPVAAFEAAKVARFTQFLTQLTRWVDSRAGFTTTPTGARSLQTVYALALTIAGDLAAIIDGEASAAEPESVQQPAQPVGPPPRKTARLEMVQTLEQPLLVNLTGQPELTDHARTMLRSFVTENEIEMAEHEFRKFQSKVVRWLESTPQSSMLVIKIGGLHGRYEPFPSYAPRPPEKSEG